VGTTLGPGEYVVIAGNYQAFDLRYDIAGNQIPVAGQFTGSLADGGEKVKLFRAGEPDPNDFIPYYRIDYVDYDDAAPWPVEADGAGSALNRASAAVYGNEPSNWHASMSGGTPGSANVDLDTTPPTVPGNLAAQVVLDPDAILLSWDPAQDAESEVAYYVIYRDDELLDTTETTSYTDTAVERATTYSYRVAAVNRDVLLADLAADGMTLTLSVTPAMTPGLPYVVTMHNLSTLSGNPVPDPLELPFIYEPQGSGSILREYWTGIGGTAVSNLTSHPNYPDNPSGSGLISSLEGPVNWANNYGTRVSFHRRQPGPQATDRLGSRLDQFPPVEQVQPAAVAADPAYGRAQVLHRGAAQGGRRRGQHCRALAVARRGVGRPGQSRPAHPRDSAFALSGRYHPADGRRGGHQP